MLGISKTRTSPYHPHCDGHVEHMNRTVIELLVLNTANPTETWDQNLGLALMAYRSAVQTSTGCKPHFLMYGREMRLPIDIIYRPPHCEISRSQYALEIRDALENAYKTARVKLHLAHERQKDYYDRRTQGTRYSVGDSVLLWSPLPKRVSHQNFKSHGLDRTKEANDCQI